MSEHKQSSKGINYGKMIVIITALCVGGLLFLKSDLFSGIGEEYEEVPQEITLKYKSKTFKVDIDEADAVRILENPGQYRKEFEELIYQINISMLDHVIGRMDLPVDISKKARRAYEKQHSSLVNLYLYDFLSLQDTTSQLYESWYNNQATTAVETLHEVAANYTCFMVNKVLVEVLKTKDGKAFGMGEKYKTPCGVAMRESLQPIINKFKERAAIDDFSASKGLMEERVESVIAELATMEVRDKKGLNKELKTKLFGYSVSSTEIEITAISVLKVGFKLDDYFDVSVSDKNKEVTITLPEPKILSHEVYPKVDKLDIGWMRELDNDDFNKNFNTLRQEFRRDAEENDIYSKSKQQAKVLMESMMQPMVNAISSRYKLRVKFKDMGGGLKG